MLVNLPPAFVEGYWRWHAGHAGGCTAVINNATDGTLGCVVIEGSMEAGFWCWRGDGAADEDYEYEVGL